MASRLRAAFRTYASRRVFWIVAGIWLGFHGVMSVARGGPEEIPAFLCANVAVGVFLGIQVKGQFANARARLLPHFATVHLLAAGAIVAGTVLLDACLLARTHTVSAPAVAALALAVIAGTGWSSCQMDPVSSWLLTLLIISGCAAPQYFAGPIQAGLSGQHPIVSVGLAIFGLAILVILAVRLRGLHEEMPEYPRRIPDSTWDFTSRGAQRDRRRFEAEVIARAKTAGRWYDLRHRLLLRWAGSTSGPLRRLLLRQLAGGSPGVFLALAQVGLVFYFLWFTHRAPGDSIGTPVVFLLSCFPVMMAMGILGGVGLRRWPYLARESLYPLGRADFVRDLIVNGACDTGIVAMGHCAGIVAGLSLLQLRAPVTEFLVPFLLLIVAQYVVVGFLTLWFVSFRRFWVFVFGAELASALSAGLVVAALLAGEAFWSPARIAVAIVLTAITVAGLYRLTYRRWCQLELP
jgi:hypothetical protein